MNRDEEKINETKRWFFEKINKSDKPLVEIPGGGKKKGKARKSIKLAMKKKIQPKTTEIQRTIRDQNTRKLNPTIY